VRAHRIHDRRARGDGAAAQIVAVGETAGQDHEIGAVGQGAFGVPDEFGLRPARQFERARDIALLVRSGEYDDGGFHRFSLTSTR
jgi:hypothetical protein